MKIHVCYIYMHAYLTLDFPNVAVHNFSLGRQCFFFPIKLLHASFILACTEHDFTLQMKVQSFPSH